MKNIEDGTSFNWAMLLFIIGMKTQMKYNCAHSIRESALIYFIIALNRRNFFI